jgi:putative oxidoreductase
MLLTNQYVPLAIVSLGAVLVNTLTFHVTMNPEGLPMALFAFVLWNLRTAAPPPLRGTAEVV